jgi:hypothetical protein
MPKKYIFDFVCEAWVQCLEVEADNLDEAKEKLGKMSLEDMIDEGYIKDTAIKDLDYEVEEEIDEDEESDE